MKTNTTTLAKKVAIVACMVAVGFSSCKKADEVAALFDQSAVDNTSAEVQFNDLNDISSDALNSKGQFFAGDIASAPNERGGDFRNCATVTNDIATKTLTIDFGTANTAACNDGKIRNGKIIITYTDKYLTAGSVTTITPQNYTVNGVKVEGVKKVTCTAGLPQPKHTIEVTNGKLTFLDNTTTTWATNKVRTWSAGAGDTDKTNDVWNITGSGSGTNRRSVSYTWTITQALVIKSACFASGIYKPVAGEVKVTANGSDKVINYGTGACDKTVTVTIGGKTFTFSGDGN